MSVVVVALRLSAESCFGSYMTVLLVCAGRRLTSEVESCFRRRGFQVPVLVPVLVSVPVPAPVPGSSFTVPVSGSRSRIRF